MTGTKEDYIYYRIQKSNETREDAIILADKKRWNSRVNRLYYSSFYLTILHPTNKQLINIRHINNAESTGNLLLRKEL
jgi:hypothetical protein